MRDPEDITPEKLPQEKPESKKRLRSEITMPKPELTMTTPEKFPEKEMEKVPE